MLYFYILLLIIGLSISFYISHNKKRGTPIEGTKKYILNIIMYCCFIGLLLFYGYQETRSLKDFFIFSLIALSYGFFLTVIEKLDDTKKIHIYVEITFAIIISFFSFLSINYMLITPLSHIWLIILAIHYIKKIFNEMDNGQCKNPYALAIFMIIVPILIVGMFMVFDESYSGVPRAKREVIAYLKEERGYTDKDINSAIVNNIEKDKELVFIAFND
ncbi:hypothetical protein, partial [Clostridiisalibacter paucivorans]|uniref:hypothetical protein n=1 Tax=Clostridiisalibacter paucivorans TaxID=408753 RepID=UPI0004791789